MRADFTEDRLPTHGAGAEPPVALRWICRLDRHAGGAASELCLHNPNAPEDAGRHQIAGMADHGET